MNRPTLRGLRRGTEEYERAIDEIDAYIRLFQEQMKGDPKYRQTHTGRIARPFNEENE